MAKWQELQIEEKIVQILEDVPDVMPGHPLGRPFLTAYQIAIEFAERHPEDVAELDLPVGGLGIGQRSSLAQYLAGQLSRGKGAGELDRIEGGFLSNQHLKDISFECGDEVIHSSLTGTKYTLSMFRLCDPDSDKE